MYKVLLFFLFNPKCVFRRCSLLSAFVQFYKDHVSGAVCHFFSVYWHFYSTAYFVGLRTLNMRSTLLQFEVCNIVLLIIGTMWPIINTDGEGFLELSVFCNWNSIVVGWQLVSPLTQALAVSTLLSASVPWAVLGSSRRLAMLWQALLSWKCSPDSLPLLYEAASPS